jgi:hypothetical protein
MLVAELDEQRALARDGNLLRLPSYRIVMPHAATRLAERITKILGRTPLAPLT